MRRSRLALLLIALFSGVILGGFLAVSPASAHEERASNFPDGKGVVPKYLGLSNANFRVVCNSGSAARIARMPEGALKTRNLALAEECKYNSIQDAVNSIKVRKTSVYVLPGVYTESKWANAKPSAYCGSIKTESTSPLEASQYIGSLAPPDAESDNSSPIALSYADQRRCPHNLNLIAIMGDKTPDNGSIACDSALCGTQVVGTGKAARDVVIDNRFSKLNGIRADRANGAYFRNFTVQQSEFNALYVLETDGFVVDRIVARGNDEYGILAFASDHGLIHHVDAYYNGDSGIYPGSASDVNADRTSIDVSRYAVEIRDSKSHDNTLGYSGTAGNSVYAHHNKFYENATGIATDSLFPGHPGLPQDHARWSNNEIFSNNENYYTKYVDTGICAKPMKDRGYINGTVCPVVPTPVGTGALIAGGNFNLTDNNLIYDNWRYGTMQFWVPAPLRDEYDPSKLFDTSHGNQVVSNTMGFKPDGSVAHNGVDHWWDDQGNGNCWEDNKSSRGKATNNFVVDPGPCADGGSKVTPGLAVKDAGFLTCSQYNRADPQWRHPPACSWFDSPKKPTDAAATGPAAGLFGVTKTSGPSADMGDMGLSAAVLALIGLFGISIRRSMARRRPTRV